MARKITLVDLVTEAGLRSLAGERYFERGVEYFRCDAVERLRSDENQISSRVIGTESYRCRLWIAKGMLDWECSCPLGEEGEFCKHLVATGLAWIARGGKTTVAPEANAIRAYLERCDRRVLVKLLIERAEEDDELASALLVAASEATVPEPAAVRETLRKLLAIRGFIEYREMRSFVARAATAVDLLKATLEKSPARETAELAEYALKLALRAMGQVDDSDGGLGQFISSIAEVHAEAAGRKAYAPPELAKRLLALELADGYGFFNREDYGSALGKAGMAAYRTLVMDAWKKVPHRGPEDRREDKTHEHYVITGIMKDLAQKDGDVDALVEVLRRDLTSTMGYLEIAEALAAAGREEEALTWAEEGRRTFSRGTSIPLDEFLVAAYHRQGRHEKAIGKRWESFQDYPGLQTYRNLKASADKLKAWSAWREKAFAVALANGIRRTEAVRGYGLRVDASLPVAILLWEGDPRAALKEARAGGCDEQLWLRLAGALEKSQPQEAIAIYGERIGPIVSRGGNVAYEEAIGLVRRYRSLLAAVGKGSEFSSFAERLRGEHRAKRNFMALLNAVANDAHPT